MSDLNSEIAKTILHGVFVFFSLKTRNIINFDQKERDYV